MTPPRRPWWKRRRWIAALAAYLLALPILYLLSGGPALYAVRRGWLSGPTIRPVYLPAWTDILGEPIIGPVYRAYCDWWVTRADQHRASG